MPSKLKGRDPYPYRRFWRNLFFVNPRLQIGFAIALTAGVLFTATLFICVFYFYFKIDFDAVAASALLRRNPHELLQTLVILTLLYSVVVFALGLLFAHRIAGPVVNLTHAVGLVTDGDIPPPVILRRADELRPFTARFNEMLKSLEASRSALRRELDAATAALDVSDSDAARAHIADAQERITPILPDPKNET